MSPGACELARDDPGGLEVLDQSQAGEADRPSQRHKVATANQLVHRPLGYAQVSSSIGRSEPVLRHARRVGASAPM